MEKGRTNRRALGMKKQVPGPRRAKRNRTLKQRKVLIVKAGILGPKGMAYNS